LTRTGLRKPDPTTLRHLGLASNELIPRHGTFRPARVSGGYGARSAIAHRKACVTPSRPRSTMRPWRRSGPGAGRCPPDPIRVGISAFGMQRFGMPVSRVGTASGGLIAEATPSRNRACDGHRTRLAPTTRATRASGLPSRWRTRRRQYRCRRPRPPGGPHVSPATIRPFGLTCRSPIRSDRGISHYPERLRRIEHASAVRPVSRRRRAVPLAAFAGRRIEARLVLGACSLTGRLGRYRRSMT
jgi:hypothetical protein